MKYYINFNAHKSLFLVIPAQKRHHFIEECIPFGWQQEDS